MKRTWRAILALTLVCAVALTAAAMALGSKALPLTMTDACTIGDPAAAEGLHMAARIGMEQNRLSQHPDTVCHVIRTDYHIGNMILGK